MVLGYPTSMNIPRVDWLSTDLRDRGVTIVGWCWFGLVLRYVCKREMLGFQMKCYQNFVKTLVLVLAIG